MLFHGCAGRGDHSCVVACVFHDSGLVCSHANYIKFEEFIADHAVGFGDGGDRTRNNQRTDTIEGELLERSP